MAENKDGIGVTAARLVSSLYAGQIIGVFITAATFILLTRLLGPGSYGLYTFALGFSTLIGSIQGFGIGSYFNKALPGFGKREDKEEALKVISSGYAILLPIALVLALAGTALSPYIANVLFKHLGIDSLALVLASWSFFFSVIVYITTNALIGFIKGKLASIVTVSVDILQLFLSVGLVLLGYGVNGAIGGMLIGYVIGCVISMALLFSVLSRYGSVRLRMPGKSDLKKALSFSAPIGANNVLNYSIQSFGILYVSFFITKEVLGNLGAAVRGLNFIAVFYNTMSSALVPLFAKASIAKEGKEAAADYNKMLLYAILVSMPMIIYIGVLAKPGVSLLLSSAYSSTSLYLSLIAFGTAINIFQFYIVSLLLAKGYARKLLKYNAASIAVQYALVIAVTPFFGVLGMIATLFIIGGILDDVIFMALARRVLGMKFEYRKLGMLFLGNMLLAIPLSLALLVGNPALSLLAGLIILIIAYPPILTALRVLNKADIDLMESIAKRIKILERPAGWFIAYLRLLTNA